MVKLTHKGTLAVEKEALKKPSFGDDRCGTEEVEYVWFQVRLHGGRLGINPCSRKGASVRRQGRGNEEERRRYRFLLHVLCIFCSSHSRMASH